MLWIDGVRLSLRRRWDRVEATFVDSRYVKLKTSGGDNPHSWEIWEYMVDVPGRDGGEAVRLTFEERQYRVRLGLKRGQQVPVVVNAKRTKAMFNLSDPRVDQEAYLEEQSRKRKERDDERFEAARRARPKP